MQFSLSERSCVFLVHLEWVCWSVLTSLMYFLLKCLRSSVEENLSNNCPVKMVITVCKFVILEIDANKHFWFQFSIHTYMHTVFALVVLLPFVSFLPFFLFCSGLIVPEKDSNETVPEVVATSGYALLHFFSDAAYNLTGFNITYK